LFPLNLNQYKLRPIALMLEISREKPSLGMKRHQSYEVKLQVVRQWDVELSRNYFYDLRAILAGGFSKIRYFWMVYLI